MILAAAIWLFSRRRRSLNESSALGVGYGNVKAHLKGAGAFEFNIVGESHYQDALRAIAGAGGRDGVEFDCIAHLYLEDNNPHDSNAVRVEIDDQTVGYLSRKHASTYRWALEAHGLALRDHSCDAKIVGGWDRPSSRGHYGVKLDLRLS